MAFALPAASWRHAIVDDLDVGMGVVEEEAGRRGRPLQAATRVLNGTPSKYPVPQIAS